MNTSIDLLLATYNGEEYLEQQIASIIDQVHSNWCLYIRDDGSADGTLNIVSKYVQLYPDKIQLINDELGRLGPSGSFDKLLYASTAPYVAFCDQDDIWLPEKLLILMRRMLQMEKKHGQDVPVLVHSDLEVVDSNAARLADSFWMYQNLKPLKMQSLEKLLVQNCVTGCASLFNRPLIDCALPIPQSAIMHDWWFALMAVSLGKIEKIDAATVKYRQHEGNDTGAKKWNMRFIIKVMLNNRKKYRRNIQKRRDQARALIESGRLDAENKSIVSSYIDLFTRNWFQRRMIVIRMGFFKYGFIRNIALMLWI